MSLSCVVVEYPCLASPGPSRTILSQLGVLACVLLAFARKAMFQLRPLSFFERLCLSFYSNMALVLHYYGASKRSSWHTAVIFLSRKVAARLPE